MRLVIHSQYYPPEFGAPQTRLSALARSFVERGHSVTVLTAMPNYPFGRYYPGYGGMLRRERQNGINIIRTFVYPTQRANVVPRMMNYASFVLSSAALGSILTDRPHYWFVESPPLFLGIAGLWATFWKRCRMIFNVSDLWPESAARLGTISAQGVPYRLSAWLEAICYRHAWLVTGQSEGILSDILLRFPGCHAFHLSNGVDIQAFNSDRRTQAARHKLAGDNEFVVLYAGLHGLAQGLDQVVAAAKILRDVLPIRFVFVGDGPEKRKLVGVVRQLGLGNVKFLEPVPSGEIPPLLAAADVAIVCLKSYIPGAVPSKLYEAMASRRPVLLIAGGEASEIVTRYQAGIVVTPGDIVGLAEGLRLLHAEPRLCESLGINGRRAVEDHYDRSKIGKRFVDYLEANLER